MNINKPCFENLYRRCCNIIKNSSDKNIKEKQLKLDRTYQTLCRTENCELQEFYSIVLELKVYEFLTSNNINLIVADDSKEGPDFECEFGYLECISTTKGEKGKIGRDFINMILSGSTDRHKSEIPRISAAVKDKKDKYIKYGEDNVIKKNKPQIIVVGTSVFANEFQSCLCIEDMMQVLYAIGNETIFYDIKSNQFINTSNTRYHNYDNIGKKQIKQF